MDLSDTFARRHELLDQLESLPVGSQDYDIARQTVIGIEQALVGIAPLNHSQADAYLELASELIEIDPETARSLITNVGVWLRATAGTKRVSKGFTFTPEGKE